MLKNSAFHIFWLENISVPSLHLQTLVIFKVNCSICNHLHCTFTLTVAAPEVPTLLLAVQLYDPELPLCMLGKMYEGPLWRTLLGLSVLNHLHVMPVLGFAAVTVHVKVAVCPSLTLNGRVDLTSGLSI